MQTRVFAVLNMFFEHLLFARSMIKKITQTESGLTLCHFWKRETFSEGSIKHTDADVLLTPNGSRLQIFAYENLTLGALDQNLELVLNKNLDLEIRVFIG